ncbi:MAG: hypothetical protein EHM37_09160 [Deltaproteobacteria bacterium]|nr:MAG: hypothetical protein EHM37_09160 [Deltaproteobacteria bacterium]
MRRNQKKRRNPLGEIALDLRLVFTIPSSKLTINGLVLGLKQAAPQINAAILTTLLGALEEKVVERHLEKDPQRYRRNGHQSKPRKFSCSLCDFSYRFAQVLDRRNGRSLTPLVKALAIPEQVRFLEEALEPGIGLCAHVSYRRAAGEVERIGGQAMSHTTIHRRLQQFARTHDPFTGLKDKRFVWLLVDGTKVHLQGTKGKDMGQAQMRWALGSAGAGQPFEPVGFWIDTHWKSIRKDLAQRLDYAKLQVLFSDGEPGIAENLLSNRMRHQRCVWHGKRDFPYLLYADDLKKADQKPFIDQLHTIAAMRMSKAQLEKLRPQDRPLVKQLVKQTQQGFEQLLKSLEPYPKARVYIENLIKPVSTFFAWWLQKGEALPLTSNAIESAFSRVCNRVKRVGRRWSDRGLLNWLTVSFYKIFKPDLWSFTIVQNRFSNEQSY